MHVQLVPRASMPRPRIAWVAVILEVFTGLLAIPVGWSFVMDPSGRGIGIPQGWIEGTVFGSYLVPGLYLLLVNGVAMLVAAALAVRGHWAAPWLTGILGVGMIIWIAVEIVTLPDTMFLTWVFLAVGIILSGVALSWLRTTGQVRLG